MKSHAIKTAIFSIAAITAASTALVCGTGCSTEGYRIGTTLPSNLRAVFVMPVKNESGEPEIDRNAQSALLREIRRDGTLTLTDESRATTRLTVVITSFDLTPVDYSKTNTSKANEYRATVKASVLFEKADGTKLYGGSVTGDKTFDTGLDPANQKRIVMPDVLKDLSLEIVDRCISVW